MLVARLVLLEARNNARIVFGVLVVRLGFHPVARRHGIARILLVLVQDLLRRATDLHIRPRAFIVTVRVVIVVAA